MKNTISLVVPVYDTPEKLECFLNYLVNISPDSLYQLIVIDDCSPISLEGVFETFRENSAIFSQIFFRHEVNRGRAAARNTGLNFTTGELVYFVDVDNCPSTDAFVNIIDCFSNKDVACVRGSVRCLEDNVNNSSYVKFFDNRYLGSRYTKIVELQFNYFATDAMCIRKSILDSVGPFDESFVKYGCEDEELGCRIELLGLLFLFCPDSVFIDIDKPSLIRESSRMVEYAEFSIPYLLAKHQNYSKRSLFSSLEYTPTVFSRLRRRLLLVILNVNLARLLGWMLSRWDTKICCVPKHLYYYVIATHYKIGFQNRHKS